MPRVISYHCVEPGTWAALPGLLFPCCRVKKHGELPLSSIQTYKIPNLAADYALEHGLEVICIIETEPTWHYRLMLEHSGDIQRSTETPTE